MRKIVVWVAMLYIIVSVGFPSKPQLTQAVTALLGFTFLLSKLDRSSVRIPSGPIGALIVYAGWAGFSLLWSPDLGVGFYNFWRLIVVVLFSLVVWNTVRDEDDVAVIAQGFIVGACVVFLSLYRNVKEGKGIYGAGTSGQMRYSAEDMLPNAVAWIFAFATAIAWILILWNRKTTRVFLPLNYAMPLIAIVGTLYTGSRGGSVALIIALIPILLYLWKRPVGAAVMITSFALVLPAALVSPQLQGNINRILNSASSADSDKFSGRLDLWQAALEIAARSPFIGTGYGGFNQGSTDLALNTSSGVTGAHQAFLAVVSETGIVGLVLFCTLWYGVFKVVRNLPSDIRAAGFGLFASLFSVLLVSHSQDSAVILFPMLILTSICLVATERARVKPGVVADTGVSLPTPIATS